MLNKAIPVGLALLSVLPAWAACNEDVPANEVGATERIVQMIEESVRAEAKKGAARRDAHAKAHGCVKAQFHVLNKLPEELKVGMFREVRTYPAWIRYSNGSGTVQDDSVGDARGMAIKLMGVKGSESGTQDLVMINHSVFFAKQMAFCENLSFTPWHALPEHRPLGGIDRVRKAVYETISRIRHELNAAPRREPKSL